YSFGRTFRTRARLESEYGNMIPIYALAAAVPFMDLVDTAQELAFGGGVVHAGGGLLRAVARSGVLGTKNFALDAMMDQTCGGLAGQPCPAPAANHAIMAAQTATGHGSSHGLLLRSLPAGGLFR